MCVPTYSSQSGFEMLVFREGGIRVKKKKKREYFFFFLKKNTEGFELTSNTSKASY